MSKQQQQAPSSQNDHLTWGIRLCRWLWKASGFLGISVFLALGINVASTWLTTPKGSLPADTPLSALTTNWPISLLVGCCLFLLALIFWAISRWSLPSSTITAAITLQDREHILRRLRVRYEQSLAQSLQGAAQIKLGLASRPSAIQNPVSLSLRLPEQPEQMLPAHTSIIDVYELAQQELLILGEPGAGKSTLLLELAHHLVEQAEQDAGQPLPVLLSLSSWTTKPRSLQDWLIELFALFYGVPRLSSWAKKRRSLQNWLIEQFALLYNVPRRLSQQWIQAGLILPLLDGLDEMDEAARPTCITIINTYHSTHLHPLVVSCRTNEYDAATVHERFALHTAVIVQPLTLEQIDAHLVTIGKPLIALRTALKKDAMLQTLATTPLLLQILILTYYGISVQALSHQEGQVQAQIWSDYVQQMVSRKGKSKRYSLEQTRDWLSWLAREMRLHNQTIFSLEQLQPNWLPKEPRIIYQWTMRLLAALLFGLLFGPLFGLLIGLPIGLLAALLAGLDTTIEPLEKLIIWSWKGLLVELLFWLLFWLLTLLLAGLLFWLIAALIAALLTGLLVVLLAKLQVVLLRFWLWRSHLFPLKATSFLEDATARILLRRIGGGYSFTHHLLLDYFADLETIQPSPSSDVPPTPLPLR